MADLNTTSGGKNKVILVGVGGPSSCGKTTLAKHLRGILPDSIIIHQDDFAPPSELIPVHPVHNVQDWDAAPGAIDWPKFVKFLLDTKETGVIPSDHKSVDHLNEQRAVDVPEEVKQHWANVFEGLKKEREKNGSEKITWGLIEGFLLYWHPEVIEQLDVRILMRVPHDILKQRRESRSGYQTAGDAESVLWQDPPGYWDNIVWPAYTDAHRDLFVGGDVEKGEASGKVDRLLLIEATQSSMKDMVEKSCEVLHTAAKGA